MSQFSDERGAELRELFFETAQELLQSLNEEALKLEKGSNDPETVRSIRRTVHTLKGDAAACGFRELSELAHELEDVLALETVSSHATLAEVAFTAADVFGAMLGSYRRKGKVPSSAPLQKMIAQLVAEPQKGKRSKKKVAKTATTQAAWTEYEKLAMQSAWQQGKRVYQLTVHVDPHCAMPIAARQLVLNALAAVGEVLGARPEAGSPAASKRLEFVLASHYSAEHITAKCHIPTVTTETRVAEMKAPASKWHAAVTRSPLETPEARLTTAELEASSLEAEELEATAKLPTSAENILRVDAERIDNVLNLVGELIIGKSMLQQALQELARLHPKDAIRSRFADAMSLQARVLNDLQRSVMKIRMVPVEQLFRRFPRLVRDVSKQCEKNVELKISGQDTDLDKSLLDAIAEPLTHLVRNAISHGIENAEERIQGGKPPHGTLRLDAYHQANHVIVEVSDDGRGIDAERVKAKAVEQRLLSSEQASTLTEAEILELLFRPGFSTAEQITEVAGRGVGLDVVQSVLHRLKGTVDVETYPGRGATFRLKLPLTLAIIKALLFRVEQRLYAIPLNTVAEIARAHESDLHQMDNYEVMQLRNQVLPVVRLGRPPEVSEQRTGKIFVLVIAVGERKLGLIVDALEGEEELVIKALDDQTVATDLVSGASILGDGQVVLILNLIAILERYSQSRPTEASAVISGFLLSHAERARAAAAPTGVQP